MPGARVSHPVTVAARHWGGHRILSASLGLEGGWGQIVRVRVSWLWLFPRSSDRVVLGPRAGDDLLGALGQLRWAVLVVGAVGHLLDHDPPFLVVQALSMGDAGQVQAGDVLLRRGTRSGLGSDPGGGVVAAVQVRGDGGVRDVDDRADHVLVQAVSFGQPRPAAVAELVERAPTDQGQCGVQVGDAFGSAAEAAGAQAAEQVGVDEDVDDLVHPVTSGPRGGRLPRAGDVRFAGAGVGPQPVPNDAHVAAGLVDADAHGVGEFLGGGTAWPGGHIGQDLGHVGLAFGQRCPAGAGANRAE